MTATGLKSRFKALSTPKKILAGSVIGVAGLLAAVQLGSTFVVPSVIKSVASGYAEKNFKRKLTIESASFNPWTLTATINGLKLYNDDGVGVLLSFDELVVDASISSVFEMAPVVEEVRLVNPVISVYRDANRQSNVRAIIEHFRKPSDDDSSAKYAICNITVKNGNITVVDDARKRRLDVNNIDVGLPFIANIPTSVEIETPFNFVALINGERFALIGRKEDSDGQKKSIVEVRLKDFDIPKFMTYLPFEWGFKVNSAKLTVNVDVTFNRQANEKRSMSVEGDIFLKQFDLAETDGKSVLSVPLTHVKIAKSNISKGEYDIEKILIDRPHARVNRSASGEWNLVRFISAAEQTRLMKRPPRKQQPGEAAKPEPAKEPPKPVAAKEPEKTSSAPKDRVFTVRHLAVAGASVDVKDDYFSKPIETSVSNLNVDVKNAKYEMKANRLTVDEAITHGARIAVIHSMPELLERFGELQEKHKAEATRPSKKTEGKPLEFDIRKAGISNYSFHFENRKVANPVVTDITGVSFLVNNITSSMKAPVTTRVEATVNRDGKLHMDARVIAKPFALDGNIEMKRIDVRDVQPWIADYVNVSLNRAELWMRGNVSMKTLENGVIDGGFKGKAAIGNMNVTDKLTDQPLLSWKDLIFEGVALNLNPISLHVDTVHLNEANARVILSNTGRLNLADVLVKTAGEKSLTDEELYRHEKAAEKKSDVAVATPEPLPIPTGEQTDTAAAQPAKPQKLEVTIDRMRVKNSRLRFTDNFIQPRYTVMITGINGGVRNVLGKPEEPSKLRFTGSVAGAPLLVQGSATPLKKPMSLNVTASVRGMDLPQLSTYSGKYIGYSIKRGKLNYNAKYRLHGDKLAAENTLMLDQLTLGDKVPDADSSLPVEFALSLLKDDQGRISINLPISGSLEDPQFNISDVVSQLIGNAIKKVVTSPFSFLFSKSEHERQLKVMTFAEGSSTLTEGDKERLTKMAEKLKEYPHVNIELSGVWSEQERALTSQRMLDMKMRLAKMKDTRDVSPSNVKILPTERGTYIRKVFESEMKAYLDGEDAKSPENMTAAEMEAMLIKRYDADDQNVMRTAKRRATAVRDFLVLKGLSDERVFMSTEQKAGEGETPGVKFRALWRK